jgi:aminoglycoside N3'-acetyltransferase
MHLGRAEAVSLSEYPARVTDLILDVVGIEGTLAVPASNWDYASKGAPFDLQATPAAKDLGVLARHVLTRRGVRRSLNPTFSLAIVGRHAESLCADANGHAFGYDSTWDRLFRLDANMLLLGCDLSELSFVRYIEMRFGVPYLYNKLFSTPVFDQGAPVRRPIISLLRYHELPIAYDLRRFKAVLRANGVLNEARVGESCVRAIRMHDCFQAGIDSLKGDVHFFLAAPPPYRSDRPPAL